MGVFRIELNSTLRRANVWIDDDTLKPAATVTSLGSVATYCTVASSRVFQFDTLMLRMKPSPYRPSSSVHTRRAASTAAQRSATVENAKYASSRKPRIKSGGHAYCNM